jgi:hypothetical protein
MSKACFQCKRTGSRVCDGLCPFDHEMPCRDCNREEGDDERTN